MNVFSLHKISAEQPITFPFALKEFKRYEFGDDRLAYRFGTELAKAFVAHALGSIIGNQGPEHSPPTTDLAVAVLSDYIPPSTNGLRNHFIAYLNRHLVSIHARPVRKIDVHRDRTGSGSGSAQGGVHDEEYYIDRGRVAGKSVIVLGDIRLTEEREARIKRLFQESGLTNRLCFVYVAEVTDPKSAPTIANTLSTSAIPPIKDIESITQSSSFSMNDPFVKYVLGREHIEFCQFLRRQDDGFARLLLDYAIGAYYHTEEGYEQNVKFLLWEVGARESMLGEL